MPLQASFADWEQAECRTRYDVHAYRFRQCHMAHPSMVIPDRSRPRWQVEQLRGNGESLTYDVAVRWQVVQRAGADCGRT